MLKTVLDKLNADSYLSANINVITGVVSDDIPFIYYTWMPQTSDKIKAQARLDLTAITHNIGDSIAAIDAVKKVILTLGDEPLSVDILHVEQNGGGNMHNIDTNTWHVKAIFTILYKERG